MRMEEADCRFLDAFSHLYECVSVANELNLWEMG